MAGSPESFKRQPELNTAEKLEAKIKKMASYWKAGFGNYAVAIAMSGEVYIGSQEIELKKHNLHLLRSVEKGL